MAALPADRCCVVLPTHPCLSLLQLGLMSGSSPCITPLPHGPLEVLPEVRCNLSSSAAPLPCFESIAASCQEIVPMPDPSGLCCKIFVA